ncbi:RNA dependent RNA polymerase-domain-containing protein [Amylostereum chailletii]|nr:RNA dependent RNA polymerase-domain-containing protein [Amylostereum chailletii]
MSRLFAKQHNGRNPQGPSVPIKSIQFGWECRDQCFSIEWEHHIVDSDVATVSFSKDDKELRVRVRRQDEDDFVMIAIRFATVKFLSAHMCHPNEPAVFLSFSSVPSFEIETRDDNPRKRLSWLPFSNHKDVAPYTSYAMRLVLPSKDTLDDFRRMGQDADIHTLSKEECPIVRRDLFSPSVRDVLDTWLTELDWGVAFQIKGLLNDLLVDFKEMLALRPRVQTTIRTKGEAYTAAFFKFFRTRLLAWWMGDETHDIETDDACFERAVVDYRKQSKAPALVDGHGDVNVFQCLHCIVTPTSVLLEGPFPEQSNRVIRLFDPKYHPNFLRVSFVDEGHVPYRFDRDVDGRDFVKTRVGGVLRNGLAIAGRTFEFLAYSQSALKEHAVWFIKPFGHIEADGTTTRISAASIIAGLGRFNKKTRHCPALYAARISQAFTSTDEATVKVEKIDLDDILTSEPGQKHHCFTDGVGTLSPELAQEIWQQLRATRKRARRSTGRPSAFHVRFMGSKGMLSVDPNLRGGRTVGLRPSMIKFESRGSHYIEVARAFDRPGPYSLNRPLIMLLEGLGVPYEVFEKYQDAAVKEVQDAASGALDAAGRMLERYGLGSSFRMTAVMTGLTKLGVGHVAGDVFYDTALSFAVYHVLRDLKNHARIPVPKGWTLVGVCDIHQELEHMEIFACVKPLDGPTVYLEGPVLISRSPVIHPGDVQVVQAIGRPKPGSMFEVEPLPNTVVFSAKGPRPIPSYLGGGDLDGDLYNLIPLDDCPEFMPKKLCEPASYDPAPKKELDRSSTMDDVADFVVDYINSDVLGMIATNWLITADQSENGIHDRDCLTLSKLHSDAVDYPKSGQAVALEKIPRLQRKERPDWIAPEVAKSARSANHGYYESTRWIGRLFRAVDLPPVDLKKEEIRQRKHDALKNATLSHAPAGAADTALDPHTAVKARVSTFIDVHSIPHEKERYALAQIYNRYVSELQSICATHTLSYRRTAMLTEEEVLVGTIVEKTSAPRKRKEKMTKMREMTERLVRGVRDELAGDEEEEQEVALMRAWMAWKLAVKEEGAFGAKSFGWVALGAIFDAVKEIEEEVNSR